MIKDKIGKVRRLLKEAKVELERFKKNKSFEFSSQAAEKCWVACNLIIEHRCRVELRTGNIHKIIPFATKLGMSELTWECFNLHINYHL